MAPLRSRCGACLLLLAGCAASAEGPAPATPATSAAPDADPEGGAATVSAAPAGPPAHRARYLVDADGSGGAESWTDVEVPGASEDARRVCETIARSSMERLASSGFAVELARPCAPGDLPPAERAEGYLLVARRVLTDVDLLLLAPEEPAARPEGPVATVTDHSAFSTEATCERMRAELVARQRADRAEAAGRASDWLRAQLAGREAAAERACEPIAELERRCAALPDAAEVEARCGRAPGGARCRRARDGALRRNECEVTLDHHRRACENERALAELLRARVAAPPAEEEPPPPVCRPARTRGT